LRSGVYGGFSCGNFLWVPYYDAINSLVTIKLSRSRKVEELWRYLKMKKKIEMKKDYMVLEFP
jgi:hypothetical protein